MLRLVLGRSKSGKTEYVRNYLSALASSGEKKLLMIVPDQQSFDTEKAFLELLGPKDSLNVKVFGFSRLCDYVFEKTGFVPKTLADESVRTLIMSMALEDTSDLLRVYSDKSMSPKLLGMMLSLQKEFARNKVLSSDLEAEIDKQNGILADKLYDANLVLSAYDSLLSGAFQDAESELSLACDLIRKHNIFDGYYVCVDSYLSFTELELDILRCLMNQSKEVLITLSDDNTNREDSIFEISKTTAKRLTALAKDDSVSVSSPVVCDYEGFFKHKELLYIEQNIFDYSQKNVISLSEITPAVSVYNAESIYEESDYVARKIRELVLTKGYKYRDIAVVCRDVSPYNNILDTTLDNYGISYFMDAPNVIHSKPIVKLVLACFDCITTSFDKSAVLALLKSGLVCGEIETISMFENYVFTWGISGSGFKSEFTANPRGFCDEFTTVDLLELTKIEQLRKSIIDPLVSFAENIKSATAETICKELYALLINLGVDKRIITLCGEYEISATPWLSEELVRLWQMLLDTLDRTIAVIGKRNITPKRFSQLLELQFNTQDISFIPRAVDQVTVGDIERLRLDGKKVVFVIGAIEGQFPRLLKDSGLFSSSERVLLYQLGILGDTSPDTDYLREEYLCYYALTSASDMLFVSFPSSSIKGEVATPSQMVTSLKGLFSNLREINSSEISTVDRLWSKKKSFEIYASGLGSDDNITTALESYYSKSDEYKDSIKILKNAVGNNDLTIKDEDTAKKLFGENMYLSASQVELYHKCAFSYFCKYGMRLNERKTASIDSLEYGSFVHYILEHFLSSYNKSDLLYLKKSDIVEVVDKLIKDYTDKHFGGDDNKSEQFKYLLRKVSRNAVKLIEHLIDELTQSSFEPKAYELGIGDDVPAYSLTLPSGNTVTIKGKVDRADIMEKNGKKYIRIVDYKTGTKIFNLSEVMYGLNLQMLIYLSALVKNGSDYFSGELIPAGVLYMYSVVDAVKAEFGDSYESVLKSHNANLRMNGLILNNGDVLEGMERELNGIFIPVYTTKKGDLKGDKSLATLEELGGIFTRIENLISEMATQLQSGNVSDVPAKLTVDACEYCPYISICRHKEDDPCRNLYHLDRAAIRKELGINSEEVAE